MTPQETLLPETKHPNGDVDHFQCEPSCMDIPSDDEHASSCSLASSSDLLSTQQQGRPYNCSARLFFLLGSILYVWQSVCTLITPVEEGEEGVASLWMRWVAPLCYGMVALANVRAYFSFWPRKQQVFWNSMLLGLAASFNGLSVWTNSKMLETIGAYTFAVHAMSVLHSGQVLSYQHNPGANLLLKSGDWLFFVGALINVLIGYLPEDFKRHVRMYRFFALVSSALWFLDSALYVCSELADRNMKRELKQRQQQVVTANTTITNDLASEDHHLDKEISREDYPPNDVDDESVGDSVGGDSVYHIFMDNQYPGYSSGTKFRSTLSAVRNGIHFGKKALPYAAITACGQLASLFVASSEAFNSKLFLDCQLNLPAFSALIMYLTLLGLFLLPLAYRGKRWERLEELGFMLGKPIEKLQHSIFGIPLFASSWTYLGVSVLDIVATMIMALSLKYTTLTSVTIFGSMSVPASMLLSKIYLGRQFSMMHVAGAMICISGLVLAVVLDLNTRTTLTADLETDDQDTSQHEQQDDYKNYYAYDDDFVEEETLFEYNKEDYPHKVLGDVLAAIGGVLYGATDFVMEVCAKKFGGPMELLAMIGFWGSIISFILTILLESREVSFLLQNAFRFKRPDEDHDCLASRSLAYVWANAFILALHNVTVGYFVLFSESALLNLSMLTSNFWAVGLSIVFEALTPDAGFYAALALIVFGIIVYELSPSPLSGHESPVIHQVIAK